MDSDTTILRSPHLPHTQYLYFQQFHSSNGNDPSNKGLDLDDALKALSEASSCQVTSATPLKCPDSCPHPPVRLALFLGPEGGLEASKALLHLLGGGKRRIAVCHTPAYYDEDQALTPIQQLKPSLHA